VPLTGGRPVASSSRNRIGIGSSQRLIPERRPISPLKRKAISPVLATVVLIAMTLTSAIAVSGFVFGLFGSFTSTAQVQAQYTSCVGAGKVCTLTMYNSGSSNVNIFTGPGCASVSYGGTSVLAASCTGAGNLVKVGAGGSLVVTVTMPANFNQASGNQVTGSIHLSNGAEALFSGTFA
jgi:flagellin-like protein